MLEKRSCPRFKLEVDIEVSSHNADRIAGRTVDISEAGLAAMLVANLDLGGLSALSFKTPVGGVQVWAVVRNRNAFRYGFEFVRPEPELEKIRKTCALLAEEKH